jgi:hypothetical protein
VGRPEVERAIDEAPGGRLDYKECRTLSGVAVFMVSRRFPLTTIVLSVVLAAECMLAGVAHRHCHTAPAGSPGLTAGADACAGHDVGSAATETSAPLTAPHAPGQAPNPHNPNDCLACQYLAKHALPALRIAPAYSARVIDYVCHAEAISVRSTEISLPLSRGPPVLA